MPSLLATTTPNTPFEHQAKWMTIFFTDRTKYIFNVIGLLGNAIIYIDMNCDNFPISI